MAYRILVSAQGILLQVFLSRPNTPNAQKWLGVFPPGSGLSVFGLGSAATKIMNFLAGLYYLNIFSKFIYYPRTNY